METTSSISLKRRHDEVDDGSPFLDDDISSSDSGDSCDSVNPPTTATLTPTSILRHQKPVVSAGAKRVRFDAVTVFYFPRRQGFTSVPSQGGSSLGMARHHSSIRRYTLGEFAREQESSRRLTLRQHLRQEKLRARKMKLTRNGTVTCEQAELLTVDDVSDEDLDVDSVEVDDCFFLQPLPTKRRRALLRASGIARIDAREKTELRAIRLSREECGCDCRLYCDPRRCGCSQAGIKCQVDRMSFPCGCSRDGCGNAAGRIEFNPLRVRTHYLHTIMKLDLEKRRPLEPEDHYPDPDPVPSSAACPAVLQLEAAQTVVEVQHLLEHENEVAVMHLQSVEEQERRVREGGEPPHCLLPAVLEGEETLLQGPFPPGATVLCITDNQEEAPSHLLKDSLMYYQLSPVEGEPMEEGDVRKTAEEEEVKGIQQDEVREAPGPDELEETPVVTVETLEVEDTTETAEVVEETEKALEENGETPERVEETQGVRGETPERVEEAIEVREEMVEETREVRGETPEMVEEIREVRGETPEMVEETREVRGETPETVEETREVRGEMVEETQEVRGQTPEMVEETREIRGETPETVEETREVRGEMVEETQEVRGETPETVEETREVRGEMEEETQEVRGETPETVEETREVRGEMEEDTQEVRGETPETVGQTAKVGQETPEVMGETSAAVLGAEEELAVARSKSEVQLEEIAESVAQHCDDIISVAVPMSLQDQRPLEA
ncbi:cysteine/serine-rich nuclear protein 2 isoform X2 [Synchiropus splendidus]|uniref:cysteine/serine-rich nuclear protein 2 isoform X2 n=1 Tax=Synchiropus splendidus TaxID=270530 RepID=UPI00237EDA8A|nr:cysteine/serine-rich nuclear protein 2 isoform X2 [Synchiropus splendidus]